MLTLANIKLTYISQALPVLEIPLTRCPPCYLHTVQALVRLLWSQIVYSAEMDQKVAEKAVLFLTDSVNMTLPNIKDQKKKKFNKDGTERAPTKKLTKEVKMLKKISLHTLIQCDYSKTITNSLICYWILAWMKMRCTGNE